MAASRTQCQPPQRTPAGERVGTGSAWQRRHPSEPLATGCTQPREEGEGQERRGRRGQGLDWQLLWRGGAQGAAPPKTVNPTHRESSPRRAGPLDTLGSGDGGGHHAEGDHQDAQEHLGQPQREQGLQPGAVEAEVGKAPSAGPAGKRAAGVTGRGHHACRPAACASLRTPWRAGASQRRPRPRPSSSPPDSF